MSRRGCRQPGHEQGAALLLTLFVMMILVAVSVTVLGAVLVETRPTLLEQKTDRTVHGAEAGLDVALNRLRAANDGAGTGVLSKLPCNGTGSGTMTGTVAPSGGSISYTVKIRYFTANPTSQSSTWLSANAIGCTSGAPSTMPSFALLESSGSAAAVVGEAATVGNRALRATYTFKTTNANIAGGLIYDYTSATGLCLAAASLAVGAAVTVNTCDSTSTGQQWSYTTDLFLQVKASSGTTYCLSATSSSGAAATLASCSATTKQQIWSFDDNGRFEGTSDLATMNGWCLSVQNDNVAGSGIVIGSCANGTTTSTAYYSNGGNYNSKWTFSPTAAVGAGKAGDATLQLINYKYFGRCFDITGAKVTSTYLIGYPCKMAPSTAAIKWNQKYFWDSTNGMLCTDTTVTSSSWTSCVSTSTTRYCVYAGTSGSTPAAGTRVLVAKCNSANTAQKWSRRYNTGAYSTSYNIVTQSGGLCLDLNPTGASEASSYDKQWGVLQVSTCDGSTRQKWNAPPDTVNSDLDSLYEQTP